MSRRLIMQKVPKKTKEINSKEEGVMRPGIMRIISKPKRLYFRLSLTVLVGYRCIRQSRQGLRSQKYWGKRWNQIPIKGSNEKRGKTLMNNNITKNENQEELF